MENAMATALISEMATHARAASRALAGMSSPRKADAVLAMAQAIRRHAATILAANVTDLVRADQSGLSGAMRDRLALDTQRIEAMAAGIEAVASLRDPVGMIIDETIRPNGLHMARIRIPVGVIGIIYESRPNVTADTAALCVKSGNAVILRGGSEATASNAAIYEAIVAGLVTAGAPEKAVQRVVTTDRAAVGAMLAAQGQIDLIIPRGGKGLTSRVEAESRVPVLAHLDGICHIYIHASADAEMAAAIAVNAKMRRTSVCGAAETLLIDAAFPAAAVIAAMIDAGCEVRGDASIAKLDPRVVPAGNADWGTEFLGPVCSARTVAGIDEAMAHIAHYGSGHTDAILTQDQSVADRFLASVDSAIVMHNASTQFADGGEFGLGAEIGIATGRLHARGPVALEGLTTYKWIVRGTGQVRP
jgi:glutamate-5-semialdehyde dehydrogenase